MILKGKGTIGIMAFINIICTMYMSRVKLDMATKNFLSHDGYLNLIKKETLCRVSYVIHASSKGINTDCIINNKLELIANFLYAKNAIIDNANLNKDT